MHHRLTIRTAFALMLVLLGPVEVSVAAESVKAPLPALRPVEDVAGLPRVLLIGDSVSMGYTLDVRAMLEGVANVHRPPENCNSTGFGLARLDKWLGQGKWDVIHFNFGLHDAKLPPEGKLHAPPESYAQNLRKIVQRLKATGARLVWATTTPIPLGGNLAPDRHFGDVSVYNKVAEHVMAENGISIDDLNAVITPFVDQEQIHADVHFTPGGYRILATQVAAAVRRQLGDLSGGASAVPRK